MTKLHYIPYIQNQPVLFPQRIDEDIAENDPVRILNHIVEHLDLSHVKNLYREKGRSPYHPKMMLKVILYAYMNNIYSCRKIERLLRRDIHFIWLAGSSKPDFITVNRFRNRLKDEINHIFTQVVLMLCEYGMISLDVEYIDGTKIESKANKYTFVWRKTTEKNREKLLKKISALLEQIDENIAGESLLPENEADITPEMLSALSERLNRSLASVAEPAGKESKTVLREKKKQIKELEKHKDKLEEYNRKLLTLGKRNSYSKTDKDATFMHMKEDAMRNGQTKPGYNLQASTENQFITDFAFYPNPTDTLTMPSFLASFKERYGHFASTIIADSGYGSEENYRYMEEHDMEAYVKYNRFHIEHRMHYTPNPFSAEGMFYNKEKDFYVCPMGQHMERIGTRYGKTDSGYITESARYRARNCSGCPLRGQCFKAKGNRVIEVNHRLNAYKKKAAGLLTSEEGIRHRGRRCIEPEAVFGQIKNNMVYRRFRHFGKDKITMDFSFFAIAFNIKKLCKILLNGDYNNLQALIKRFFEWVLRLKLNSIAFLGYKQMKIAIWPLHKKVRLYSDLLLSRGYFDTFYMGSWEEAIDYITQNSLIFQELYFPRNGFQKINMPFLADITTSYQGKPFKKDFREIYSIMDQKGIGKLYHFTDASNIESIKRHGLISNHTLKELNLHVKYSSTQSSREADAKMGLDDFVRLSFVKTHPMLYTAMTSQGIHPVIIEINPLIALMPQVYFSDKNALRTGANIGDAYTDLNKVRFDIVLGSKAYYDLSLEEKRLYQAEILVKERIGPEFILNYQSLI